VAIYKRKPLWPALVILAVGIAFATAGIVTATHWFFLDAGVWIASAILAVTIREIRKEKIRQ
jgi:hypothetical protein